MSLFASALVLFFGTIFAGTQAHALDLDWHGQFRAETNWLWGYSHGQLGSPNTAVPSTPTADYGYFIPMNGDSPAAFQNLFLRLDPRVIVNDNVTVHTDIWVGTPDMGMFGGNAAANSNYPTSIGTTSGTGNFQDTRTGKATITASEFYADVATDFGMITVGRAPLNYGLGLIWNNNKEKFDRLPSTGDVVRMVTKLGAFKFSPAIVKYRLGSNYGGSAGATTGEYSNTIVGGSGASDYTLALSYTNDDEQIDLGLLFLRRIAGSNADIINPFSFVSQTPVAGQSTVNPGTAGYAYNVWDFYVKKQAGALTFSAEVPIVTGLVANQTYSTVAGAAKLSAKLSETWTMNLNAGTAGGQDNTATATPGKLNAFYFHPDYRPGLLMFNYSYRNLSNGSLSPYDNPVNNAKFVSLNGTYNSGKWTHEMTAVYAVADKAADGITGDYYFNGYDRYYKQEQAGATAQDKGLGFEMDYGLGYDWDEYFRLGVELGLYFPGKFYAFSDSATPNAQKTVFGSNVNLTVKF